ncbi:MAG: UDP-N-acetylmuramoyl-L-alanyl-D-glutamate--2,6-diaminopimelate ligase [Methylobacter sp.]|nr:MAG: UDP-N-acetylmuramoyl-L-alanyl-D-glutamate--2,6-diaminopimelate ligase [Methylobacter sp.]
MNLQALLNGLAPNPQQGLESLTVEGLALDSRLVRHNDAFIALNGSQQHGLAHAAQAISNGAGVIIYDPAGNGVELAKQVLGVPVIAIDGLSDVLGEMAARFYGDPSQAMAVIGITGTNGKTSCSQFLAQMLDACGIIGTLGWGEWGKLKTTANTTPDALSVQQMLASLRQDGKQAVAMEVSSHGLDLGRVNGVKFTGAVYTNITRDHLDYHGTMDAYLEAKLLLLKKSSPAFVVVNLDAEGSDAVIASIPGSASIWGVSRQGKVVAKGETLQVKNSRSHAGGLEFDAQYRLVTQHISVPLYGDFNIENVMLVLAVMLAMGMEFLPAAEKLRQLRPVAGRMECFGGDAQPLVFVDYAHTPDALDKVLSSARNHCRQSLWTVFGCGGNRDSGKRPLMGAAAGQWADRVIVTDDNPRNEDSAAIIKDILSGCDSSKTEVVPDREQAIHTAVARAGHKDCIVVAGKGHEDYQEVKGVKYPFSDRQVVLEALARRA